VIISNELKTLRILYYKHSPTLDLLPTIIFHLLDLKIRGDSSKIKPYD
jgi:hypothetical protein